MKFYNSKWTKTILSTLAISIIFLQNANADTDCKKPPVPTDKYAHVDCLHEGMAIIQAKDTTHGELFGFVNAKGEEVIAPIYDYAKPFNEGRGYVRNYGNYALLNNQGKPLTPFKYKYMASNITTNIENAQIVADNELFFLDPKSQTIRQKVDGREYSLASQAFVKQLPSNSKFHLWQRYIDGYNIATATADIGSLQGMVHKDKNGVETLVVPFAYEIINYYGNPQRPFFAKKDEKFGLIDVNNKQITDFIYDSYDRDSYEKVGLYAVEKNGKYGFIDDKGATIVPFIYDDTHYIGRYNDNIRMWKVARNKVIDGKKTKLWGAVNDKGELSVAVKYPQLYAYDNGMLHIDDGKYAGMIDQKGNIKIPMIYRNLYYYGSNLYKAETLTDDRYEIGLINENNEIVIEFGKYSSLGFMPNNSFLVTEGKVDKIIDSQENTLHIFKGVYRNIDYLGDDLFHVAQTDFHGIIDKNEKAIIPIQYTGIYPYYGFFIVKNNMEEYFVDKQGGKHPFF